MTVPVTGPAAGLDPLRWAARRLRWERRLADLVRRAEERRSTPTALT